MDFASVHACLNTLGIHQTVDQNVWSIRNVNKTWHVLIKGATVLVGLEFVELTLNAMSSTTMLFAHVYLDIKVLLTLSLVVLEVSKQTAEFYYPIVSWTLSDSF